MTWPEISALYQLSSRQENATDPLQALKCPINGPNMGGRPHSIKIGAADSAEHILLDVLPIRLPLAQILASGPQCALSLNFFEKARPCLFSLQFLLGPLL